MSWYQEIAETPYLNVEFSLAVAIAGGGSVFMDEPDASGLLFNFLNNTGSEYTIDFYRMNRDWDYATANRISQVNEAIAAAEAFVQPGQTLKFMNTDEYQNGYPTGSGNWVDGINKYDSSIECTVTQTSSNTYSATIYYYFNDFYNFDKDNYETRRLPVSQHDMWNLVYAG